MKSSRVAHMELVSLLVLIALVATPGASAAPLEVPEAKQTTLAFNVTAKEAYGKWKDDPEHVKIVDVRTIDEFIFVGHPEMAWNVPFAVQTYEWDSAKKHFAMKPDPDFVSQVKERFTPDDTLLVMCRSGGRGAMAVNALAKAGFKNVYNIIDGMEGDSVEDPESAYFGKRMKNGWKNSGVPWTYQLDPERMRLPKQ